MNLAGFHVGKFREGVHFRRLDPVMEGQRIWRFTLIRDAFLRVDELLPVGQVVSFRDKHENEWMRMVHNGIWVRKDYSWNGCTPKFYFCWIWWGTPDFKSTIQASLFHDALYQFSCTPDFPLHRSDCDEIFKRIVALNGTPKLAAFYHRYVRKFGRWDGDPSEKGEHSVVLHP